MVSLSDINQTDFIAKFITIYIYHLFIVTGMVKLLSDKMRVNKEIWLTFFERALKSIGDHLEELMKKPECNGADTILMVGGFSESTLLQEYIMKRYVKFQLMKNHHCCVWACV